MLGAWVAKEQQAFQRPVSGWEPIKLPHTWDQRGRVWEGSAWYRIDWHIPCNEQHWGLAVSGMRRAGSVYWGDELLWTDRNLSQPFSSSGNAPRWWPLSTKGRAEVQTVWVRIVGYKHSRPGLGKVDVDKVSVIRELHEYREFRQKTSYVFNAGMSLAVASVTLFLWFWRRKESRYFWFGCMQLSWLSYLTTLLQTDPLVGWEWINISSLSILSFLLYCQCFWMFSLRFLKIEFPLLEKITWGAVFFWLVIVSNLESIGNPAMVPLLFCWGSFFVQASCVMVVVQAVRKRQVQDLWLALCWSGIFIVAMHDIVVSMRLWSNDETWSSVFGPVSTFFMAGLLGWQLAVKMGNIDRFNARLQQHVEDARNALAEALAQQHAKDLAHARVQERVHLVHELHDGFGGSLVRSMAMVEHEAPSLQRDKVLSMLKLLRDDLRQVIDAGSSEDVTVPTIPALWLAPLRHRFTLILDELEMTATWQVDASWRKPPTALQCMAMARFLEEGFANVLKHSRARCVVVCCMQAQDLVWRVSLQDDGVGFDVAAVQDSSMGIGMQSMRVRLVRVGGTVRVQSGPTGTTLTAEIPMAEQGPSAAQVL